MDAPHRNTVFRRNSSSMILTMHRLGHRRRESEMGTTGATQITGHPNTA